jgi:hypothetical protein
VELMTHFVFEQVAKKQYFVHKKVDKNITEKIKQMPKFIEDPNFSVSAFFFIIAFLMFICSLAFIYVDVKYAKKKPAKKEEAREGDAQEHHQIKERDAFLDIENESIEVSVRRARSKDESKSNHCREKAILLIISFLISCFMYGILPGI